MGLSLELPGTWELRPQQLLGYRSDVRRDDHGKVKSIAYTKLGSHDRPAVYDVGHRIYVNDDTDASIRTALVIMAERCRGRPLRPFGPAEFIARVEKIARAEGIAIDAPARGRVRETVASKPVELGERAEMSGGKIGPADLEIPKKSIKSEESAIAANAGTATPKPANAGGQDRETDKDGTSPENRLNDQAKKPASVKPPEKPQETLKRPDPAQEAAKASAAAWAGGARERLGRGL